jgi:tetratricopeptide (TPR) repeat protein
MMQLMIPPEKDVHVVNPDWEIAGSIIKDLLVEGPDPALYAQLGELYLKDEKPEHARFFYASARALAPDNETFVEGWQKADGIVADLESKFIEYSESAANNEITSFGSMAAIRFHLGHQGEGIAILQDAIEIHGTDPRFAPLIQSFMRAVELRNQTMGDIYKTMLVDGMKGLPFEELLTKYGQMVFIGLGNPRVVNVIEKIQSNRDEPMNPDVVHLLQEFAGNYPVVQPRMGG